MGRKYGTDLGSAVSGAFEAQNIEGVALKRDPGAAVLSALNALGKLSRGRRRQPVTAREAIKAERCLHSLGGVQTGLSCNCQFFYFFYQCTLRSHWPPCTGIFGSKLYLWRIPGQPG